MGLPQFIPPQRLHFIPNLPFPANREIMGLVGTEESGKTGTAIYLACLAADQGLSTLYLDLEGGSIHSQLQINTEQRQKMITCPMVVTSVIDQLITIINQQPPADLIIIDPWSALDGSLNSADNTNMLSKLSSIKSKAGIILTKPTRRPILGSSVSSAGHSSLRFYASYLLETKLYQDHFAIKLAKNRHGASDLLGNIDLMRRSVGVWRPVIRRAYEENLCYLV